MAFLKFGKKKSEGPFDIPLPLSEQQPQSQSLPVEQVLMMKQQGYTNNQITQTLQSQGYNSSQIFDAINQAGLSGSSQAQPEQFETGMSDYGQNYEQQYPQQQFETEQTQSFEPQKEIQVPASMDEDRIQEVAEAIIDEKWQEISNDIRKVIEWKDRNEDRIAKLEQQIIDLRLTIDSLTKSVISKVSSYDQNIVDVGTEIKAMEKVFQKILPTLTENVNKLDRIAKSHKEPQEKK